MKVYKGFFLTGPNDIIQTGVLTCKGAYCEYNIHLSWQHPQFFVQLVEISNHASRTILPLIVFQAFQKLLKLQNCL